MALDLSKLNAQPEELSPPERETVPSGLDLSTIQAEEIPQEELQDEAHWSDIQFWRGTKGATNIGTGGVLQLAGEYDPLSTSALRVSQFEETGDIEQVPGTFDLLRSAIKRAFFEDEDTRISPELAEVGRGIAEQGQIEVELSTPENMTWGQQIVVGAGQSIAQAVPLIFAEAATRGRMKGRFMTGGFVLQGTGSGYAEARQEGLEEEEARRFAAINGGAEIFEIGPSRMLSDPAMMIGKDMLKQFGEFMAKEVAAEEATYFVQEMNKVGHGLSEFDPQQLISGAIDVAASTILAAPGQAVTSRTMHTAVEASARGMKYARSAASPNYAARMAAEENLNNAYGEAYADMYIRERFDSARVMWEGEPEVIPAGQEDRAPTDSPYADHWGWTPMTSGLRREDEEDPMKQLEYRVGEEILVDPDGNARPATVNEQNQIRDYRRSMAAMGLTPDVLRAQRMLELRRQQGIIPEAAYQEELESLVKQVERQQKEFVDYERELAPGPDKEFNQILDWAPTDLRPAPKVLTNFPDQAEWRMLQHEGNVNEFVGRHLQGNEQAKQDLLTRFAPLDTRDQVTAIFSQDGKGFYRAEERMPIVNRAIDHVRRNPTDRAYYVEGDLVNLGGLNKNYMPAEADKIYSAMAQIASNALAQTGARVQAVRRGGDELTWIVVGPVNQKQINEAIGQARSRIESYVVEKGLDNVTHGKVDETTGEKGAPGTGVLIAGKPLYATNKAQLSEIIDGVMADVEMLKRERNRAYNERKQKESSDVDRETAGKAEAEGQDARGADARAEGDQRPGQPGRTGSDTAGQERGAGGTDQGIVESPGGEYAVSSAITETQAFKDWFGDSLVVDENGEPLVVYHRTSADFDSFAVDSDGPSGPAIFFGESADDLPQFHNRRDQGDRIIPAYVSMVEPLALDEFNLKEMQERWAGGSKEFPFYMAPDVVSRLKEAGFDGVIVEDVYGDGKPREFVVFDPTQIKSVNNRGTFDPSSPNILEEGRASYGDSVDAVSPVAEGNRKNEKASERVGNLDRLKEYEPAAYEAVQSAVARMPQMEQQRFMEQLEMHKGTPWAASAVKGLVLREAMYRFHEGNDASDLLGLKIWGKQNVAGSSLYKAFMKGPEAVAAFARVYDFVGSNRKAEQDYSGSFVNCNPSRLCAKECYAANGTAYTNSLIKTEFTEFVAEMMPQVLAERVAEQYESSAAGRAGLALRTNEKGDLSQAQLEVVRLLNQKGIRIQIFSKRPDLLRQADEGNLRMLSIDQSNTDLARENADLNLSVMLTEDMSQDFIREINPRVAVYLPIKTRDKTLWDGEGLRDKYGDQLYGEMRKNVCPIDSGKLKLGDKSFSFVQVGTKVGKGKWTCTACDKHGAVGCFNGERQTEKAKIHLENARSTPDVNKTHGEILQGLGELLAAGELTNEEYAEIRGILDQRRGADGRSVDAGAEGDGDQGRTAGQEAAGADDQGNRIPVTQVEQARQDYAQALDKNTRNNEARNEAEQQQLEAAKRGAAFTLRGISGTVLGNSITKEFQDRSAVSLLDQEVSSVEDLAVIGQIYRNPSFETVRYIFVKDGKVVHTTGVSSRLPGQSAMFPGLMRGVDGVRWLRQQMEESGADGFYMMHNHPSGNPSPSRADILATQTVGNTLGDALLGHVVINHTEYSVIDGEGNVQENVSLPEEVAQDPERQYSPEQAVPSAMLDTVIDGPQKLMQIAKSVEAGENAIILVGRKGGVVGKLGMITEIDSRTLEGKSEAEIAAVLKTLARQSGSADLLVASYPSSMGQMMVRAVEQGVLVDALSDEGFSVRESGVNPMVASMRNLAGTAKTIVNDRSGRYVPKGQAGFISMDPLVEAIKVASRIATAPFSIAKQGAMAVGRTLFFSSVSRVRNIDTPTARKLADMFRRPVTYKAGDEPVASDPYVRQDMKSGELNARLDRILQPVRGRFGLSSKNNERIVAALRGGKMPADPALRKAVIELRALLDEIHEYAKAAGLDVGYLKDYFPRVYDDEKIARWPKRFINMLTGAGLSEMAASEVAMKITEEDGVMEADITKAGRIGQDEELQDWNRRQSESRKGSRHRNLEMERKLDVPDDVLQDWLINDVEAVMSRYIDGVTRRVEYARTFGPKEEILNEMVRDIVVEAEVYGKQITRAEILEAVYDLADITMGRYNSIRSHAVRRASRVISGFEVMSKLSLVSLTSLSEFGLILGQGGVRAIPPLLMGIADAANESAAYLAQKITGHRLIPKTGWREAAEDVGLILPHAINHVVNKRFGGMSGRMTNAFMRATLLEQLTNTQRVVAMQTGLAILKRNAKHLKIKSTGRKADMYRRQLAEMGISVTDAIAFLDGGAERRASMAALNFANIVIQNPKGADMAPWMSDPHWALVTQFKRFTASMSNTTLKRMLTNLKSPDHPWDVWRELLTMVITATLAYYSTFLRDFIRYDGMENPYRDQEDSAARVVEAVDRAGLTGHGTYGMALAQPRYGFWDGTAKRIFNLMGPALNDVAMIGDAVQDFREDRVEQGANKLARMIPVANITRESKEATSEIIQEIVE